MKKKSISVESSAHMSDWTLQRTISTMAGVTLNTDLPSDPTSDISVGRRSALTGAGGVIQAGTVIRSGVGSYDCSVRIGGKEIGCQIASNIISPTYGYSLGFIPPEGTRVLVALPSKNAATGIVLGFVPMGWKVTPESQKPDNASLIYSKTNAGYEHYEAFQRIKDPDYSAKVSSVNHRPSDVLHGEVYLQNENSCGFFGGTFSSTLKGGGSFVRVSRIDEMVRVRSANYERWSDAAVDNEYNDFAWISDEEQVFSYQGERYGEQAKDDATASSSVVKFSKRDGVAEMSSDTPYIVHPRIKNFRGAYGAVETKLVERPEKKKIPYTSIDDDSKDEAVFSSHTGEDGKVAVRSAGGISLERYDRIPSIRRIRKPYDPTGNSDDIEPKPIKPFKYNKDDEAYRPLELFDALAWEQKGVYQRFDELDKDFKTQEEQDLKTPEDENGDPCKSKSDMSKNDKRRCGIYFGQNGSITIRDAWGSEINMVGGNIYLNAAGSIISTANKSIVSFANDTNVMKAKEIAAVESMKFTEIRGVNYTNIQGGYTGGNGGVLIESFGTSDQTTSDPGTGHDASTQINGITLKSESGVNIKSDNLRATVDSRIAVACGKDGERNGSIFVSSGDMYSIMENSVMTGTKKAIVSISSGVGVVGSSSVFIGSRGGTSIISNSSLYQAAKQVPVGGGAVSSYLNSAKELYSLLDPKEIVKPYDWDNYRDHICSQLGTSAQYKTDQSLDLQDGDFKMYAPYWHTMKNDGNQLLASASPKNWSELDYPVYDNCAWPGKDAIESGKFAVLEKPVNLKGGYSVKREELKDSTKVEDKSFKKEFKV